MKKEKKRLPIWSKILVFLVILVVGSFLTSMTRSILYIRNMVIMSTDPGNMKRCAVKVAPFPEPLPAGYVYSCGVDFDIGNMVLLAVDHVEDKQKVLFLCHLQDDTDAVETKQLLDRAYDFGITTDTAACKFTDVKSKGELPIGPDKMLYMTGVLKDQTGKIYEGVVGCARSKAKKKTLLIYSLSQPGKALNLGNCFNLLKSLPGL